MQIIKFFETVLVFAYTDLSWKYRAGVIWVEDGGRFALHLKPGKYYLMAIVDRNNINLLDHGDSLGIYGISDLKERQAFPDYRAFKSEVWYQYRVRLFEDVVVHAGFDRVPSHKGFIAQLIQDYVVKGGFVFAMCSAPETLDIAFATRLGEIDIVVLELDGILIDPYY